MSQYKQGSSRAFLIPARLESTRLARKMLLPIPPHGKPLICVTAENALRVNASADVYVITDSEEIINLVTNSPIPVNILQTAPAPNGTARTFDAIRQLAEQGIIYQNIAIVQGDVPNIYPKAIELVWSNICQVTTLVTYFTPDDYGNKSQRELENPNIVKAVCERESLTKRCYYFTRSPIPYAMKHIGVYGINGSNLINDIIKNWCHADFVNQSYIAEQENLEQLNWLSAGYSISASYIPRESAGTAIDTQADYDNYCKSLAGAQ